MWAVTPDAEVIPLYDLRVHQLGSECWCHPDDDDGTLIHHSMDGREAFENGTRLPS